MNTMLRWSPIRQFHYHYDVDDLPGSVNELTDGTVRSVDAAMRGGRAP
jgi:hypothetical protein